MVQTRARTGASAAAHERKMAALSTTIMSQSSQGDGGGTGPWAAATILNSKSPIVSKDMVAFLSSCVANWDTNYTEEQKRSLIDSLPLRYRQYDVDDDTGRLVCPVSVAFVREDKYVRAATIKFKEAVRKGLYGKGWQNQARKAMQDRADGRFDEYLRELAEEEFGDPASTSESDDQENGDDKTEKPNAMAGDDKQPKKRKARSDEEESQSSDGEWQEKGGKGRRRR